MAKEIYTLVDTDYVRSCVEFFIDMDGDANEMPPDDLEKLIDRIVADSTDGRLREMLEDDFRYSKTFDRLLDIIEDCIRDFMRGCINRYKED